MIFKPICALVFQKNKTLKIQFQEENLYIFFQTGLDSALVLVAKVHDLVFNPHAPCL